MVSCLAAEADSTSFGNGTGLLAPCIPVMPCKQGPDAGRLTTHAKLRLPSCASHAGQAWLPSEPSPPPELRHPALLLVAGW
jgi:hypothetical protein